MMYSCNPSMTETKAGELLVVTILDFILKWNSNFFLKKKKKDGCGDA